MEKIKFRKWGYLGYVGNYKGVGPMGMSEWEDLILDGLTFFPKEGERYMQYTGLKDRNNKEIYEGDIVLYINDEYLNYSPEKCVVCFGYHTLGKEEYYSEKAYGFYLKILFDEEDYNYTIKSEDIEIFGNIYENPELLKEKIWYKKI